jgi:1-aminocyclopropane-1-carboxylate deaminase
MIAILPSPIQEIQLPIAMQAGVALYIMRLDLNHSTVQGNKLYKLLPIFERIRQTGAAGLITFGGAYSNHLYATAALAQIYGLASVGVVRGTWADQENETLQALRNFGMQLHFVSATDYQLGVQSAEIQSIIKEYQGFEVIAEGAYSRASILSCRAIGYEISDFVTQQEWVEQEVHIAVCAGTGGTATGILAGLDNHMKLSIFGPTQKGINREMIYNAQLMAGLDRAEHFEVNLDYTFGGFGRRNPILDQFMKDFYVQTGVLPDPVYTCKMFYGITDMIRTGKITTGSKVIMVHSGGLQGWNESNRIDFGT